ncbi:hypothetical protein [Hymenobacter actinosclerus]|uniref:Uncharacterized protein n=1 Tax=Hymenobacter actinosclerus TaxID=82805 RepID=A0A1I0DZ82_9BACT|nr:hypothetical protein [Hymenobacter actinosclerus]SET37757.1 hypothetical protein SAMN04487998_1622 [Hymenobacter actinosclerus]
MKTTHPVSQRPPGHPPSKALKTPFPRPMEFLPALDPASQQLEREADATMTLDKGPYYTGSPRLPAVD